jgi:hypothetical protein
MKPLSRRTLLRGAGGVAIALPFLEAMQPRVARAQAAAPKRLVMWYTANGQMPSYWYPTGTETNFTLNKAHAALEPYKSKLILLDGINNDASKTPAYGGHQGSHAAMISGMPHTAAGFDAMRPTGPSIDQRVADRIGGATRIKHLPTGTVPAGSGNGNPFQAIGSWRGAMELIPPIVQPSRLFDYLFSEGVPGAAGAAAAEALRKRRKSILDAVAGRFAELRSRVGIEDKARLDKHVSSIREIETQVLTVPPQMTCMLPTRPADNFSMAGSNIPAWSRLNLDLMILALACDVTRVANYFWFAMGSGGVTFSWLGHTNTHHNLAHANALKEMTEINTWFSQQLLYLMQQLDKYTDVGGASLLDSTLILWWNELGDGAAHLSDRAPFVLAGGAGGTLKMGRFLNYAPRIQSNQLLLTVYNVLTGSQDTTFGDPKYCPGPAPGL